MEAHPSTANGKETAACGVLAEFEVESQGANSRQEAARQKFCHMVWTARRIPSINATAVW